MKGKLKFYDPSSLSAGEKIALLLGNSGYIEDKMGNHHLIALNKKENKFYVFGHISSLVFYSNNKDRAINAFEKRIFDEIFEK